MARSSDVTVPLTLAFTRLTLNAPSGNTSVVPNQLLGKRRRNNKSQHLPDRRSRKRRPAVRRSPIRAANKEPWHRNQASAQVFKYDELIAYIGGAQADPTVANSLSIGDDSNCPVHPIFRQLSGLATGDQPFLSAALRLATRFLVSKGTLPFFHQLITAQMRILIPESQTFELTLYHIPPSPFARTGLPPKECKLTLDTLDALAEHISFGFISMSKARWAETQRRETLQFPARIKSRYRLSDPFPSPASFHNGHQQQTQYSGRLTSLNFRGSNVRITLSSILLTMLHAHRYPALSRAQRIRGTFFFAYVLLHELAHAVYRLRMPPDQVEPFYSTQRIPELGHAWSTSVFRRNTDPASLAGGIILPTDAHPECSLGLVWTPWPSFYERLSIRHTDPHRHRDGHQLEFGRVTDVRLPGGKFIKQRRQGRRYQLFRLLQDAWLARFFTPGFWDDAARRADWWTRFVIPHDGLSGLSVNPDWDPSHCSVDGEDDDEEDRVDGLFDEAAAAEARGEVRLVGTPKGKKT